MRIPELILGAGKYTVSVAVAKSGYYEGDKRQKFDTINEDLYCQKTNFLEIEVLTTNAYGQAAGVSSISDWVAECV